MAIFILEKMVLLEVGEPESKLDVIPITLNPNLRELHLKGKMLGFSILIGKSSYFVNIL